VQPPGESTVPEPVPGPDPRPGRRAVPVLLLATGFLLAAIAPAASAQDCLPYGDFLRWQGAAQDTTVQAVDVHLDGRLAYVLALEGEVLVHEIPDVGPPVPRGRVAAGNSPDAFAVKGTRALVPDEAAGLDVVDLADPDAPEIAFSLAVAGGVRAVAADADLAVLGAQDQLLVYTRPLTPASVPIGQAALPGPVRWLNLVGTHVYADCGTEVELQVVSLVDPAAPALVATVAVTSTVRAVLDAGEVAYVADVGHGIRVLDVSTPDAPVEVATLPLGAPAVGLALAGDRLLIAASTYGLMVADVSDPAAIHAAAAIQSGDWAAAVAVSEGRACLADADAGLQVYTGIGAGTAAALGSVALAAPAATVTMTASRALVPCGEVGLQVVDLADPAAPAVVATVDTPGSARDVAVTGDLACVADSWSLEVIDLAAPGGPTTVGSLPLPGPPAGHAVLHGDLAYVVATDLLHVVDIGDPAAPASIATLDLHDYGRKLLVHDGHLYVALISTGIAVYDLVAPAAPALVGTIDVGPWTVEALAARGDWLYAGGGFWGLAAIDIADPAAATVAARLALPGGVRGLACSSAPVLWVADDAACVQLVALEGGLPVASLGTCPLTGPIRGVAPLGDLLVAVGAGEVPGGPHRLHTILPVCLPTAAPGADSPGGGAPTAPLALQASPNPFNPTTRLDFVLPAAGPATLRIHDVRGRAVRTLWHGRLAAGPHSLTWDGADAAGRPLPSGTYLCRLATGSGAAVRKVVLVE